MNCLNNEGGSACVCDAGYAQDGELFECIDINECLPGEVVSDDLLEWKEAKFEEYAGWLMNGFVIFEKGMWWVWGHSYPNDGMGPCCDPIWKHQGIWTVGPLYEPLLNGSVAFDVSVNSDQANLRFYWVGCGEGTPPDECLDAVTARNMDPPMVVTDLGAIGTPSPMAASKDTSWFWLDEWAGWDAMTAENNPIQFVHKEFAIPDSPGFLGVANSLYPMGQMGFGPVAVILKNLVIAKKNPCGAGVCVNLPGSYSCE
jgi:hypothetical protein